MHIACQFHFGVLLVLISCFPHNLHTNPKLIWKNCLYCQTSWLSHRKSDVWHCVIFSGNAHVRSWIFQKVRVVRVSGSNDICFCMAFSLICCSHLWGIKMKVHLGFVLAKQIHCAPYFSTLIKTVEHLNFLSLLFITSAFNQKWNLKTIESALRSITIGRAISFFSWH